MQKRAKTRTVKQDRGTKGHNGCWVRSSLCLSWSWVVNWGNIASIDSKYKTSITNYYE